MSYDVTDLQDLPEHDGGEEGGLHPSYACPPEYTCMEPTCVSTIVRAEAEMLEA